MLFAAVGVIVFFILFVNNTVAWNVSLTLGIVCTIFLVASIFGIVLYNNDRFYFQDGTYYLKKPFKKLQSVYYADVSHVDIKKKNKSFSSVEISFVSKDEQPMLTFFADGWIFKRNVFLTSLYHNRIKVNKDFTVAQV